MVKIDKTPLRGGLRITKETDYRGGEIFDLIVKDCRNKCYICEDKNIKNINVEHRVSHHENAALKYDWNNLFLSCVHCNNTKGTAFDGIIDPAKIDPEDYIVLSFSAVENLKSRVYIQKISGEKEVDDTIELLERVYNNGLTAEKRLECANLRIDIKEEIEKFNQYIKDYEDEPDLGYDKLIMREISRESKFAAFKRKIVRDKINGNKELFLIFRETL